MILSWMIQATLATALAAAAAALVSRGAGAPRRWWWLSAPILGVTAPLMRHAVDWVFPGSGSVFITVGDALVFMGPAAGTIGAGGRSFGLEGVLIGLWAGSSATLLSVVIAGHVRLAHMRREWKAVSLDGTPVLLSSAVGPAVVGLLWPRIVVPEWITELARADRTLVLAHEEEHVRAGDSGLLTLGLLLAAAMPWNLPAWFALARLREAVETDCDSRVLARTAAPTRYARLLVDVASRHAFGPVPLGAGFAERPTTLERRVGIMLGRFPVHGRGARVASGLLATLLVGLACSLERGLPTAPVEGGMPVSQATTEVGAALSENGPVFTPFTVAPVIKNRDEVVRAMDREYPPLLREAGIGGTVKVYFFIDETGVVRDVRIDRSSGQSALDEAALRVGRSYRFEPARNRGERVPVWVSFPLTFSLSAGS